VLHALIALGYSDKEAVAAIKQLPKASPSPTASGRR
jgi:Holliday junction resolvasome RuvABC DNA-binding subunit